ncbi:nucleoside deaminase [Apibacter sp.]|uniref:nucleoside deaminase n=1 Tax=Apibacter sp. TaxID=2023709 RepID=UPI0025CFE449|nr:nucleoside deaminase [Apibacter sp.]MCT6868417.1 nucleoside deaminase [Apibacter sp.]
MFTDEYYMKIALQLAKEAFFKDEIPVGALIVANNKILAKSYNLTELLVDVTAHAEMQAITAASNLLGAKYLINCTLYVTLEPCTMCAGALYWSQISRVVVGTSDKNRGFLSKGLSLHPKTEYVSGILENECSLLLKNFFESKR